VGRLSGLGLLGGFVSLSGVDSLAVLGSMISRCFVGVIQLLIVFFVGGQWYMDYPHETVIPRTMIVRGNVNVRVPGRKVLAMEIGECAREIDGVFEERSARKIFVVMVL
jgi:hypothetical protein